MLNVYWNGHLRPILPRGWVRPRRLNATSRLRKQFVNMDGISGRVFQKRDICDYAAALKTQNLIGRLNCLAMLPILSIFDIDDNR